MLALALSLAHAADAEDPRLWLEDVMGEPALEWVRARNAESEAKIGADPGFAELKSRLLAVYDSDEKIPYVYKMGDWYYNFWKDAEHPRGVWRRTTWDSYVTDAPAWEVILDVDALNAKEGKAWVWGGATCLRPEYTRCLVDLSDGGKDASVVREFDVAAKDFVAGGFELPEAKGGMSWIDLDHVWVATDFGEGSMTDSGYPRVVKRWARGTALSAAETIYEGQQPDISVGAFRDDTPGYERDFVYRGVTFYTNQLWELDPKKGLVQIQKPDHTEASVDRDRIYFTPREDWAVGGTTYKAGSLLAADYAKWKKGKQALTVLFEPSERTSLSGWSTTQNHLILTTLEDVKTKVEVLTPGKKGWARAPLQGLPEFGQVDASPVDADEGDDLWMTVTDFVTPTSLWRGAVGADPVVLKKTPEFFDATGIEVSQHFATSKDGTKIPYFQVGKKDRPAGAPTLLWGYGGFEVSIEPSYSATTGIGWLERGGTYVIANIRGGGEYGPRWHQAALKENRHRAYEDFAAVAEDLVKRGVTTPATLGAQGGSNGGLLMGTMYTLYPQHFGAIVCQVPLLDMKRYTKLLAGASWAGEYGDPDTDDWKFIQTFSPYHNLDASKAYPKILFTTSTRDDRVHPGHARKMAHALIEMGKDVAYYENIEGGHGGAANNEQAAFKAALGYTFLWNTLTAPAAPPAPAPAAAPAQK